MPPEYGETWVYESLVGTVPGLRLSPRQAIAVQIILFESAVLAVAAWFDLWGAVPAATAAVVVAGLGSWLMLVFSQQVRAVETPEAYRRLLFGSSIEVALSVVAFVLFVTYLFVIDPGLGDSTLLSTLLGSEPPALAVVLLLLISWDVVYRIGTCWWATVIGLWRALTYDFDDETTSQLRRLDSLNIIFAGVQLLLLPFLGSHPILAVALLGHLAAVLLVATLSILLQR